MDLEMIIKERLHEGQIFKSKQELFRTLDLIKDGEIIRGKHMKLLEDTLSDYLTIEKEKGNSIKITNINNTSGLVKFVSKRGVYMKYAETILLSLLINSNTHVLDISYTSLFNKLGMSNTFYNDSFYQTVLQNEGDISHWELNDFFIRSYSRMKSIVDRSLSDLENKSLIKSSQRIMIVEYTNSGFVHRLATENEISFILECERKTLSEMGFNNKADLFFRGKGEVFYSKVYKKNTIIKNKS